jgi:hypothetical protein
MKEKIKIIDNFLNTIEFNNLKKLLLSFDFPWYLNKIDTKVTPSKGDAVFFKSLDQSSGKLLVNSLHQGMNVIKGKKIICNKWIHLNKFKL